MMTTRQAVLILGHNDATQFIDIYNQYTKLFDQTQYQVTVGLLTGEPRPVTRERLLAEEVIFFNFSKKQIRGLKLLPLWHLYRLSRQKKFRIVICHRYKPIYLMMWIAKLIQFEALFAIMHELNTMSSRGRRFLMRLLYRQKKMFFAGVSDAVRNDLRTALAFIPQERVITLYNAMDMSLCEPRLLSREAARDALSLPSDAFIFGNIARLVPNKDQHTLIRAFATLKATCPQAKLIILGEGALEGALKAEVAALQLQEDILFTGFLPHAARYIKAFDCFVLSSVQEAFGRVLLEAMLAKCPIIATRAHGIPEVMGKQGILVDPGDMAALTEAMKQYYHQSKEALRSTGEQGYTHLSMQYALPAFQQQFWQHLNA